MIGLLEDLIAGLGESGERLVAFAGAGLVAAGLMVGAAVALALLDGALAVAGRPGFSFGLRDVLLLAILVALAQRAVD